MVFCKKIWSECSAVHLYLFFLQDNWTFPGCFSFPNSFSASSVTFSKPHLKENFIHYNFITFNFWKVCLIIPLNTLGEASQTFLRLSGNSFGCVFRVCVASKGLFTDELMAGFCLGTAGMVQFHLRNPKILNEHGWHWISYLQTQQCQVFSRTKGTHFCTCSILLFQIYERHKMKEYPRLFCYLRKLICLRPPDAISLSNELLDVVFLSQRRTSEAVH